MKMPKPSEPGDLVVWYASGRQKYVARGRVAARPERVKEGFGPYRGQVGDMQWIKEVDRKKVITDCGFDGGHQGPQSVPDEMAVGFLRSIGLPA